MVGLGARPVSSCMAILVLARLCHPTFATHRTDINGPDFNGDQCKIDCKDKFLHEDCTVWGCWESWDYEAYEFCWRACWRRERSPIPAWLAVVGGVVFPIMFGVGSYASAILLDIKRPRAIATLLLVTLSSLVATLVPPLSSQEPFVCAEVRFDTQSEDNVGLQVFPIVALGASGSYLGVAVALAWQCTKARTSLSWVATVYFVMVTIFNTCGVIGICFMSCAHKRDLGPPFYAAWIVSSFITNLVLQKIVLMRAMLVDASKVPRCLRCIFIFEVVVAVLLFVFSLGSTIRAVTHTSSSSGGDDEGDFWKLILYLTALLTFFFVVADLVFSVVSSMAMQSGLRKIKSAVPATTQPNPQLGLQAGSLAQAVFFAKVNLWLVVLSVSTTSLFYASLISLLLSLTQEEVSEGYFGFLYISWLLDSLFNDICVMFVGFGPTAKALEVIASAATADVIGSAVVMGNPSMDVAYGLAPSSSDSVPVAIGVPAGVPQGSPANTSAESKEKQDNPNASAESNPNVSAESNNKSNVKI